MTKVIGIASALLVAMAISVSQSQAALTTFASYNGTVAVSTDGFGSTSQSGTLTANAPVGSTVLAAYLYTSTYCISCGSPTPGGTLNGTPVSYTSLGTNVVTPDFFSLTAYRANVTSIVAPIINGGAGGAYNFNVTETDSLQDGEALVVVYSNAALPNSSVGILDGFSAVTGDSTAINFADPLNPSAAGFFAEMRLGIGFSCCTQASTVTVNGTTITTQAGNFDDGLQQANGSLITMGGDNDAFSPLLPSYADDHERYNLVPYIANGDTSISIRTLNPSHDDNIFLAVFHVSGEAGFNQPPPTGVPEPGTLGLLGIGLAAMGFFARKR